MESQKTWVQAIVDPKLYPNIPGSVIRLWGHDFKIYTDKSLCLEMHNDYVANEVKAGRVKIMATTPPGIVKIELPVHQQAEIKIEKPTFTTDIGTFYGAGSLNELIKKVGELTNKEIREFSKERFDTVLPNNMNKADMLEKIRSLTDLEFVKFYKVEE